MSARARQPSQKNHKVDDSYEDAKIDVLVAMGFDVNQARLALKANSGDVDLALDDLCSGKRFHDEKENDEKSPAAAYFSKPKEESWQTYQEQEDLARHKVEGANARNQNSRFHSEQEDEDGETELTPPKHIQYPDQAVRTVDQGLVGRDQNVEHRVGAVAVVGPRLRERDLEIGENEPIYTYTYNDSLLATARAVDPEPITAELVPPDVDPLKPSREIPHPYWTRMRILLAAIVLLVLVGCAVVGAILGIGINKNGGDQALLGGDDDQELVGGGNAGFETTQPPPPELTTQPPPPELTTQPPPAGTTEDPKLYTDTVRPRSDVGDRFADFVAISRDGSTIVSGAEVGNYVQVYRYSGTAWNQIGQTLNGSGQFGKGVDLNQDGSMVIVGAWNAEENKKGHARVFRLDGNEWKQVGQTLIGDEDEDVFGWYVSMSDDGRTVAASARTGDAGSKVDTGYVRVYSLDSSDNWVQLGGDLVGESTGEELGRAMAMSENGRRLAVGTTRWNQEKGIVRVFDFYSGNWNQVGGDLSGTIGGDWFGSGVALSADGNVLAIGADGVTTDAGNKAGLVRAFHLEGSSTWKQYGQDILGEGNQGRLGMHQVALSSDGCCLAAGAFYFDGGIGKGYVYTFSDNKWNKAVELSGDDVSDHFGESVSVSGDCSVAVFGASEYDTSRPGYFRVYHANHERPC
jgi:hypothetical protein